MVQHNLDEAVLSEVRRDPADRLRDIALVGLDVHLGIDGGLVRRRDAREVYSNTLSTRRGTENRKKTSSVDRLMREYQTSRKRCRRCCTSLYVRRQRALIDDQASCS